MEESEKADSEPIPTNDDASPSQGKSCALCGCATPAVRCDRCNSQIFCLSCDDMYHRHPKRKLHLRKAVDSIWTTARSPRLRRRTELPGDPCKIPIPPPRSKKREHRTVGGRTFLKSGLELGSFGHSKVFSPASKDFFAGQKSPASMVESNCDDGTPSPNIRSESGQIYENDNITNTSGNLDDRSPWNPRPNISSPIQVSIPSSSPDIVANGQSFGYPAKPHSQSAADLPTHTGHPIGHHPYHFHPPYPYMHPPMHPYSHSMAHLNCAQCISSSWSNLISPHPSPYFHPMPWGSAQNTLSRPPVPGQPGPMKHSHGDLSTYPDSGFHYPYPGAPYYHNGPPIVDPNFIKDLHEQAEMQKLKKEAKSSPRNEEMDVTTNPSPMTVESSSAPTATASTEAVPSTEAVVSTAKDAQAVDETPVVPEKPTEPWSCVHCTFINPPGIYICQVCCKTSYGNKPSEAAEDQIEDRPDSRDTDSPLINRDALINSPGVSEIRDAQKDVDVIATPPPTDFESKEQKTPTEISSAPVKLTTETQTFTTTKTTDVQTQNITRKSIASSTDSIFPKQEISVQTEIEALTKHCSVATDPMISSQSLESLLSGVSAPPYHNRRAGWGRGATSFSTQSLYERGRSRSPMPRSHSFHTEVPAFGRDSSFTSEEAMHSASQAWLYADPMYYKPHNRVLGQSLTKEDYFDGTWGSMDRLNHRVKHKKDKEKLDVRPKFHRSLDDLKSEKKPEFIHTHELMMLQTVKEAERCGFTLEDLHVAYLHCGKENPVFWLEDNWPQMIKNVIGLAAKYGEENEENDVGAITTTEAKEALRIHRGDIWDAVAECIETRQRKILELTVRGNFTQKQIAEALKNNEGNVELAYADLLRASTKRHKFILSPGLSTDSEDLNVYNPTEDSTVDHNVSLSPLKASKLDASPESKSEKKKSDFLTKLTAIREAQSERRKAREEKELIRETITQDLPISAENEDVLKEKDSVELTPSISREDSKEVEEILQVGVMPESDEILPEAKLEIDTLTAKDVSQPKETVEDSIPVDFDTNWSESQGEWIEEYSDEHWEEGDEHWVGLGKKFQKMQKEFEEEAMQMAALWEKEELEDDVFEEETKVQQEVEAVDSDKKFNDWVKANLKVDSSEYEEEIEIKDKQNETINAISLRERLELEGSHPSPLQHYPTALDLSLKSQFESDWVDLPADSEIEKLAHDIVCEGSDIENKFDEAEMVMYEEEKQLRKVSDQGSDEDWEKIEIDEQLQEVNELDRFAFPEKEGDIDRGTEEEIFPDKNVELPSEVASEIVIEKDATVLYKNLENVKAANAFDADVIEAKPSAEIDMVYIDSTTKMNDQPKAPVRRKSKLSSTDIDEALRNQSTAEISSDIPPPLPEKIRPKGDQQKVLDIYAVPDKTAKGTLEDQIPKEFEKELPSVPQKPPRLNLSPVMLEETVQKKSDAEKETEIPKKILPKEGSPITSLSYESDSNFFADSESETEVKQHRPKNIHRKLAKYENEFEESEMKDAAEKPVKRTIKEKKGVLESLDLEISQEKLEDNLIKEKEDMLESNFDLELDDDIDPSLIEPLPRMKDSDYDPELPILLGGRGRIIGDIDDVNAPKAFREDTTRPLQLFKATKKEVPTELLNMPTSTAVESPASETSFIQRISDELPLPAPVSNIPYEVSSKLSEPAITDNQTKETFYYNDSLISQQSITDAQMFQLQSKEEPLKEKQVEKETIQTDQPISTTQEDEMPLTELEALSAVADYFFGRYNEITVTPPKKKTSAKPRPVTPSTKSASKVMSSSAIVSSPHPETVPQMEQSAAAVLQEKSPQEDKQDSPLPSMPDQQKEQIKQSVTESVVLKEAVILPEKPKQPAPTECLSFAEDYLFGCYNQVVPPRKTKNVPVISAKIPKLEEILSSSRPQSPFKEQKPTPVSTPEPPELPSDKQEQEILEEDLAEEEENDISVRTDTSAIYDEVFHDLPPEMLSNQSFDESSIYYESFQDAVEDTQSSSVIDGSVVNVRPKSVHFEEPKTPVVPPRRNKTRSAQKAKAPSSSDLNESYANEYLFRQYEQGPQAKKKLPLCSEDFRMNQGLEPTEIPCDTPLTSEEEEEELICSETSAEIPSKLDELCKSSSKDGFRDSEQSLDLIKQEIKETELNNSEISIKSDHSVPLLEDNLHLTEKNNLELVSSGLRHDKISTDIQSEKSESFEELSVPDNLDEIIESSAISEELYAVEKSDILSDPLHSSVTESEVISVQQVHSYDTISNESSNQLEMDQFVFIEQSQDIIDDSYNLYDIQDSLVCDLNYVDVKGNIEDECTDDSEQEWKRNEDRKNTLNASFLTNVPMKKIIDDEEEAPLETSQQYDQEEIVLDESQNEIETVLDETPTLDMEKIKAQKLVMDESEITKNQVERESSDDQNLVQDFDLTETVKEDMNFPERSEDISSDNECNLTDVHDAELNESVKTIESEVSSDTDKLHVTSENIYYDNEKIISEEIDQDLLECSQDINEVVSSVDDEFQILSESITTEHFEQLSEKIDENLLEIEKELFESVPYVSEYDDDIAEESTMLRSSELDGNIKEEIILEAPVKETEIFENDDIKMTEKIILEISKEGTEISEINNISIMDETMLESSKSEFEISETSDTVAETIKLKSIKEKTDEVNYMDEDKFLSEDQPICVLEDFEASEELSDDNASTHSSVSTQIAVSMKIASKEIEGDECSLNLEQIDNFEDDNETNLIRSETIAPQKIEDTEQNVSEIETVELKSNEDMYDVTLSKEEKYRYETENFESECPIETAERWNELKSISSVVNKTYTDICAEKTIHEESVFDQNFKHKEEITDNENIIGSSNDGYKVTSIAQHDEIKDHILSSEVSSCIENIVPEVIETVDSEGKLNKLENDEIETLIAEESIMSHFYDEWYQSEASTNFTYLSAESIYAKYGKAESSESGNESDVDSNLSAVDSKHATDEVVAYKSESSLDNQILVKEVKDFCYDSEIIPPKEDIMYEETVSNIIITSQESVTLDASEVKNETDMPSDLSIELKLESIYDNHQICKEETEEHIIIKETEISSLKQEKLESAILQVDVQAPVKVVKEQETLTSKSLNNKFSTSKSCQTEDEDFEEDVFFDSFDDTFTIPSYIHLPIETQTKPPTTDISIQCELISIDDILSSKKILNISQTEVITSETQITLPKQYSSDESKLTGQEPKESELVSEEKEESSCESFEDSDSDIFIESPSSQDELDVGAKRGLLYAEVDSDTGFSSGSECGWTKKSDYKQKELKKISQTSSVSKVISLQTSACSTEEKEVVISVDSSIHDIQEKSVEISNISEKKMAADHTESDVEILSDITRSSPLPPEIIERAITPVAIPQFPSFEDDLVFVEVKEAVEDITDNAEEEMISATSTTPTVEYFYGPLPETVKIDSPPDSSEKFFETASELSESVSFDKTESFADSTSSLPLAEKVSLEFNADNNTASITKSSEDESFAETISSLKGETEESMSEYYSFHETSASLISRASIAESDIFEFSQSEISTDDFLVDSNYLSSNNEDKQEKSVDEKFALPISDISKINDLTIIKDSDKISNVDAKEISVSCDITQVTECKKSLDDQILPEEKHEDLKPQSIQKIDPHIEIQKAVPEIELIDSKSELSTEEIQISGITEFESVGVTPVKSSSEVPSVPSDIVRYLYYDDSITFDDESYHTQSGSVEAPSLSSQEGKIDSIDKVAIDETKEKISASEVCTISSDQATHISKEKITISAVESENEFKLSNELIEKNIEMHVQESQEIPTTLETTLEKTDLATAKVLENITDAAEKEPEMCLIESVQSLPETDIKFPSIEVLPSESIAVLPATAEQTFETIAHKVESVTELAVVCDTPVEALSLSSQDHKFQEIIEPEVLKQTSSEIPPVPSDIVRYLYYDDDITFDEMTESSFHSLCDNEIKELKNEQLPVEIIQDTKSAVFVKPELIQDVSDTSSKLSIELHDPVHEESHLIIESNAQHKYYDISLEESSFKLDSGSAKNESSMSFDNSEHVEDWFDLRETTGLLKHRDSEQYSSTRSSAIKEDSEPPCIPEYILSPKLPADIPIGKNDVDEITDISTHFTMTDDSDRFSDIENDISLNFEDECVLPVEVSDQFHIDQLKDEELFESCIKNEDDEMYLNPADIEDAKNEFQFLIPEPLKEFPDHEKITESASSKEIAVALSEKKLEECMVSIESSDQQTHKISDLEFSDLKEKFDENIASTDSSELFKESSDSLHLDKLSEQFDSREIDEQYISCDLKDKSEDITENFDECITSSSELSRGEFAECLTLSELVDQKFDKDIHEKVEGIFDESIKPAEISQVSEEQFVECLISDKLTEDKITENVDKMSESSSKQFPEQLPVYMASDENGNFPEQIVKKDLMPDITEVKDHVSTEILEISPSSKILENASIDGKRTEIDSVSLEHSVYSKSSSILSDKDVSSYEEPELNLQQTEVLETIFVSKDDNEESCHISPIEESHSVSTEVSDNWSDADGKYIEEDESIYDVPLEDINIVPSDTYISVKESKGKLTSFDTNFVNLESLSCESEVIDSEKMEAAILESSIKEKFKKADIKITETTDALSFKSDMNECIELIENKQSEISPDYSYETDKISKIDKILASDEEIKSFDNQKILASSFEQKSEQHPQVFYHSLLSSDIKLIHGVKLETESEISSTMKEKIHVECMSTTSGVQPTFPPSGTICESQDVQSEKISSKEVCLEQEIITSSLTPAFTGECSSEDKITKETQIISSNDIQENLDLKIMGTKSIEILDSELSEYASISDSSKSTDVSSNYILPDKDSEVMSEVSLENKSVEEFYQSSAISASHSDKEDYVSTKCCDIKDAISFISTDIAKESVMDSIAENEKFETKEINKNIEIVDFKGDLSKIEIESTLKTSSIEAVCVKETDKDTNEQVNLSMVLDKTDLSCETEQNVEIKEKITISDEQLGIDNQNFISETSVCSLKTEAESDFKDVSKEVPFGTLDTIEIVDFKGSIAADEEYVCFKRQEYSTVVDMETDLKFSEGEKLALSSDSIIPSEVVDFKGEIKIDDLAKTESADKICYEMPVIDRKETKSQISIESFDVVDFKLITNQDIIETQNEKEIIDFKSDKLVDEKLNITKDLKSVLRENESSFETIDFKGQINNILESEKADIAISVSETLIEKVESIKTEILKPVELIKPYVTDEPLPVQKEVDFHKAESCETCEVVDFKGQITAHHDIYEPVVETVVGNVTDTKFTDKIETFYKEEAAQFESVEKSVMSKDLKEMDTFETLDFKGNLSIDEKTQTGYKIRKDASIIEDSVTKKLESSTIKIESSEEVTDFKEKTNLIYSEMPEKKSEAIIYDSQKTSYSFLDEQDITSYDQLEKYNYKIDEQVVTFDSRETYGYSSDEQIITSEPQQSHQYKVVEEQEAFESQPQIYCYEMTTSEAVGYAISTEESSELYSCTETLSGASDTSVQFHSFSHDLEDALNVSTSEDFTDVPSHLTSIDGSDKWSDVEGDFSLDDVEYERDKTPTRTQYEIITTTKEEFKSNADDTLLCENLTELVGIKAECVTVSDNKEFIASVSEIVIKDLDTEFKKDDTYEREIASDSESRKEEKQKGLIFEEIEEAEAISLLPESDKELKSFSNEEIGLIELQRKTKEEDEQFSNETDLSLTTASEDVTDYISLEGSENFSDVENEIETQLRESEIFAADIVKQSEKFILETEITHQITSDQSIKTIDIHTIQDDSETPLREHFADIKSLKDPLTTAVPFSSFDVEKAVPKMHEYISRVTSSQPEKTESELWLEAETEHSISELSEDIAVCIEKDGETKFIFVDYEKPVECIATVNEPSGTPHTSTTSTSSSYSDFESSDHTSDTYADISLQGATTESSDKWSDFEAEGLIEDVLYDNIEIPETVEIIDISQLIKKPNESKLIVETQLPEDVVKVSQSCATTVDLSSVEEKLEREEIKIFKEEKTDELKQTESTSIKSTDFSSNNISEIEQTISAKEESILPSSSAARVTVGLSDEEFTDVTPLEITTEASDKLSDISDDTSLGEIEDEGSVSLTANLKIQDQELDTVLHESKNELSSSFKENETISMQSKVSEEDSLIKKCEEENSVQSNVHLLSSADVLSYEMNAQISGKEQDIAVVSMYEKLDKEFSTSVEESAIDEKEQQSTYDVDSLKIKYTDITYQSSDSFSIKSSETVEQVDYKFIPPLDDASNKSKYDLSEKKVTLGELDSIEMKMKNVEADSVIIKETANIDLIQQTESKRTTECYIKDKIDAEDSSSSKITDDSETLDNFTDVPTHTVTSETSDAYLDLDSDHSFEELESLQAGAESTALLESQTTDVPSFDTEVSRNINAVEYYENSLSHKDILEGADDFYLDAIPENELENYEEEEYSLSEHFEINEDELIYPLPYNDDWIEQSFELKEYGVEAEFFESESDIHGLGVTHEDYDDEDIQRAIDYNLSTFEGNEGDVENVITTESFKTLSRDVSPHLKPDEYDTWSTTDAPSIEEEFPEQDNVLSKIDEILAEDFDDLGTYQTDSYLKHDEDTGDYLPKHISSSYDKSDDFIESDKVSLAKSDSKTIHEVAELDTTDDEATQKQSFGQILETKLDTGLEKISQKKDSAEAFENKYEIISDKIKLDVASSFKIDFETTSTEISMQEDSSLTVKAISDSVKKDATGEIATSGLIEEKSAEIDSKSLSGKNIQETFTEVSKMESDTMLSDISTDKNVIYAFKPEDTSSSLEITAKKDHTKAVEIESEVFSEWTMEKYSKFEPKLDSETVSDETTLIKNFRKVSKEETVFPSNENEITLEKDSVRESTFKSDSVASEITVKKDFAEIFKSETVSDEVSIVSASKPKPKPDFETAYDEITIKKASGTDTAIEHGVASYETVSEDSIIKSKIKCDAVPSEVSAKGDYVEILKTKSEGVSSAMSLQTDSKSEVKSISDELTLKKSSVSDSTRESKTESDPVSNEISVKKQSVEMFKDESQAVSIVVSLHAESKSEVKSISDELTLKKSSVSDSTRESKTESDSISSEISVKKQSVEMLKSESEAASTAVSLHAESKSEVKSITETISDELTLKKSSQGDSKLEYDVKSNRVISKKDSIKEFQIESDLAFKEIDEKKDCEINLKTEKDVSLSKNGSAAVISVIDTHKDKDMKDQFSDVTLPVSRIDSSDIPLTKTEETQDELSITCKILKESEVIEPPLSSLQSESLKHSIKSASEFTEVQLNIPEEKVYKDELSGITDTVSKEQTSSDSVAVVEVKPDIPKKTKRKSLDLTEVTSIKEDPDKKPSLPPKKSKRHSLTDSASSSFSESLSSSSSVESIGSFESAVSDKMGKSSSKSSDETSMHSLSPEVPVRRSRSSKTSSSRSTSRDSDDSSSCSRSSSLKIRRRSSNFAEPEPIDLSKKRASIDERMRKLQNEGKCTTKEKAFIAAKLIEMQFEEEDALLASRQCNTVYHAVKFLTQLCEMCNCRFPINLMSSLVNCTHRACKECLRAHFTSLLYDRSVFTLLCPICHKPDITDQNIQEYFTHLDMTLRNILEDKVYDLFQRKLRDEVLTKDPNFHWCSQCSSGFIASPRLKKLYCPDCSAITCAMCHQTWELEHEGVHCERFQQWKDMHTPEPPPAGLVKFLIDRGISCPSCGLVYAQACGGCMIYKCSHCNFEFCGFCIQPLKKGRECSNEICDSRGHHIHHLHNCLYFLRDKDITEIQMLLEEESVTYYTIPPKNQIVKTRCQVREQKNNHGILTEDRCGRSIEPYCGGLCRTHYYEYLAELLRKNNISPLSIMTIQDLQFMLRKSRIFVPEKVKGETSEDYYERLLEFVTKSLT